MSKQLILAVPQIDSEKGLIQAALRGTSIADATREDLVIAISATIERGCFFLGLNKSQPDKDSLKLMVIEDCKRRFKDLTLAEIKLAIDNGVHGFYGEVRGMAPRDVYHWLDSYKKEAIRQESLKELKEGDEIKWSPNDDERARIDMYTLETAWLKFKETGSYIDYGNSVYNILDVNRKINLSVDQKNECLEKAKSYLISYYAQEKRLSDDRKLSDIVAISNQVRDTDRNIRVVSEAKRIALTMFFENMVKEGKDIYQLFK